MLKNLFTPKKLLIIFLVVLVLLLIICCTGISLKMTSSTKENFDPNTTKVEELRTQYTETVSNKDTNAATNGSEANKLDPISNPRYNMQQIVKQSILLEEHLSNRRKRCRDCITKHFNHIIGLCEEAVMLNTDKPEDYCPHLKESVCLYNDLFKDWLNFYKQNKEHDEKCMTKICDRLRSQRKKLITCYFFNEKTKNTALNYKDTYTNQEHLREHMTLENPLNVPSGYTIVLGSRIQ